MHNVCSQRRDARPPDPLRRQNSKSCRCSGIRVRPFGVAELQRLSSCSVMRWAVSRSHTAATIVHVTAPVIWYPAAMLTDPATEARGTQQGPGSSARRDSASCDRLSPRARPPHQVLAPEGNPPTSLQLGREAFRIRASLSPVHAPGAVARRANLERATKRSRTAHIYRGNRNASDRSNTPASRMPHQAAAPAGCVWYDTWASGRKRAKRSDVRSSRR
jgi:hypothetical protein